MRISRVTLFMEIAQLVAKRSTCARLNVGAIITMDNRIRSIGYNGQEPGEPHCQGDANCPGFHSRGACPVIHAERNALAWLPEGTAAQHIAKDMYVTSSPCVECYVYCAAYGVKNIFFSTLYRVNEHLLEGDHCEVWQVMPTGYVMNFRTKQVAVT